VVALPRNKNSHFPRENRIGFFKTNVAQLVRKNRKPTKINASPNQMVATLLAERSAKARA
jgi:hypothetical protein